MNDPGCAAQGAKVTRPPHVVLWDRDADTLEMSNPPEQCTPEKIFNSRGLHILACRKNGDITDLWTRTATTQWKQEAVVDVAANKLERVSSSEDGTLVVHGVCTASSCAPSYLRQPRASGEQNIWSAVDVPQSLTVIPLLAGNAIVASQRGDQTTSLQLWFVEGGERLSHLLEVPEITEPVNALTAHDNSTTLKLHLGDPMTSRAFVIQGDGTLVKP